MQAGEIVDAAVMRRKALDAFLAEQIEDAREQGVLFSVHLKATMMKVSDPIIFGHAVRTFFKDVFDEHGDALERAGASPNNGLASIKTALEKLDASEREAIEAAIEATYETAPKLAMVDSDRGITNLHVPSDVIIDASMPAMIRTSGQMWNADGDQQDAKAVIPDSSYAALYAETIDHCREHGAFDPATMGTTPNVGLMAQKAEEYGSPRQDVRDRVGGHRARAGLGRRRAARARGRGRRPVARAARPRTRRSPTGSGSPSSARATAARPSSSGSTRRARTTPRCSRSSTRYLPEHDTDGAADRGPARSREATRFTLERARNGEDTIAATGNVLRDYLTDLFPILELGTSAKMLSIVPLMNGGGLFETGAGGSAPKHVQQLVKENHLRWDSLGEFLALAVSLEMLADKDGKPRAKLLGQALDRATGSLLENGKSPSRKVGELDNRGSHYWLARYWARELADQDEDAELAEAFGALAERLEADEEAIVAELEARAGRGRRPRRLLPRRPRQGDERDAPERDLQRGDRLAVTLTLDHVIIRAADPAAALAELADRGGLPVLAAVEEVGGLHSGIARAGSIDVEVLKIGTRGPAARRRATGSASPPTAISTRPRASCARSASRPPRRRARSPTAAPGAPCRSTACCPTRSPSRPAPSRRASATGSRAALAGVLAKVPAVAKAATRDAGGSMVVVTDYEFDAAAWRARRGPRPGRARGPRQHRRAPHRLAARAARRGHAAALLRRRAGGHHAARARGRARAVRCRGCDRSSSARARFRAFTTQLGRLR